MKYKIVTDSSANLQDLSGVDFSNVPLKIVAGDREFVDNSALNTLEMLDFLAEYKGKSGTSCPNVNDWMEAFGDADYVFAISITSSLSGSYNACMQAKELYEETFPGRQVCCLDSLSTGPEMVLLAEKIRELIISGQEFDTVKAKIRGYMSRTHLLFSLESLNNLARNGRVSPLIAKAAGLLGIRLIGKASEHGQLQPVHKTRGEKQAVKTIFKEMTSLGYQGGKVRIANCVNRPAADALAELVRAEFPDSDIEISECGGLCCFYAEKGGFLVGFEG